MNKTRVISFLSGKGGSGKTTASIAISKLLADMGYKCLLVDLDLTTNGAAYFFSTKLESNSSGIQNLIQVGLLDKGISVDELLPLKVFDNFFFIPSNVKLKEKTASFDTVHYDELQFKFGLLQPIIERARRDEFAFVIIDCQAGYSIPTIAAAEVADLVVIVSEADAISSDAAENLIIQLGDRVQGERRYLINKIDIRDAKTYSSIREAFLRINRLPPLPFDFAIRTAFGARQVPVDTNSPTPFVFALYETIKFIFFEIYGMIESRRIESIDMLRNNYEEKMNKLLLRRTVLERELSHPPRSVRVLLYEIFDLPFFIVFSIMMVPFGIVMAWLGPNIGQSLRIGITAALMAMLVPAVIYLSNDRKKRNFAIKARNPEILKEISIVQKELDAYRSLIMTQSKEYFFDAIVSGEADRLLENIYKSDSTRHFD